MLDLDDYEKYKTLDAQDFLSHIDGLPDQTAAAWALAGALSLPDEYRMCPLNVVIAGMGGSAIGGALAQALAAPECPVPIIIWRDYGLPAFVGPQTLVICASHSGSTEETLSAWEAAERRGARRLVITTGGRLAEVAQQAGVSLWRFEHHGQPRAAVGFSFMLTLAALVKLGVVTDKSAEVTEAVEAMRVQQAVLKARTPAAHNPAKQLARRLVGRLGLIFAADYLAPVARRWKGQLTEVAKTCAFFDELPEMDHNAVAGTDHPQALLDRCAAIFLDSTHANPRNRRRSEVTREIYQRAGLAIATVEAAGRSPLAHMLTALHFGDYTAYYLALCHGADPTAIPPIDYLKKRLAGGER